MSDQADTTQDTQQTEAAGTEQAAPDPMAQLMARMDELTAGVQGLSQPAQQDERGLTDYAMQQFEQDDEFDGTEDQYGYDAPDDDAAAEQQAYQQLQQVIADQVRQGVQDQINPFIVKQQAEQLEQKYPDLAKPENAARVMQQADQRARAMGMPELAGKPEFIEMLYLAERASQQAAQETPADGGTGVHMEHGGAQPNQPQVDERDRIVGMGQSRNTFGW